MSACLSVTVITSVDTRLNAATATISVRMMNIIVFSICTASYQAALVRVQSCTRTSLPSPTLSRAAAARASCTSARRSCTPVGPPVRYSLAVSSSAANARPLSYS